MNTKRRILVIEDEHAIRHTLKNVLEMEGFSVVTASDGQEGYEYLRVLPSPPSAILLDLVMPGTNGWNFLDLVRNDPATAKIPVIICSAYYESAKSVKPDAIIHKPVQLNALIETLENFCA